MHSPKTLPSAALAMLVLGWWGAVAPAPAHAQGVEADVVAVIEGYHAALASGDSTTALSLLAADVVILESGNVEDKDHYRSGHLGR